MLPFSHLLRTIQGALVSQLIISFDPIPVSDSICCGLYPVSGRDDSCAVVINVAINLEISDHVKND